MFSQKVQREVTDVAKKNGWLPAALLAVAEVESAGRYEWNMEGEKMPPIRFEGHYFWRRLSERQRRVARREGLAHPRAGRVKNPRSWAGRYRMLERAKAIDEQAALESISMGLGQVMGAHWRKLGYSSVQAMFERARSGVVGQIELMVRYVQMANLGRTLSPPRPDFARFARGYNGPAYKRYGYHTKMQRAFRRWQKALDRRSPVGVTTRTDDVGLRDVQRDLKRLGYPSGPVDGKMGPKTRDATKQFQADHGLNVDGIPGPMTREELQEQIDALGEQQGANRVRDGVLTAGVSEAGQQVMHQVDSVRYSLGGMSQYLEYALIGLTLLGLGLVLYGLWKKFGRDDEER